MIYKTILLQSFVLSPKASCQKIKSSLSLFYSNFHTLHQLSISLIIIITEVEDQDTDTTQQ